MRCLILSVLLIVVCLNEASALPKTSSLNRGDFPLQNKTQTQNARHKIKLNEMIADVLYLIVNHLNFTELINLADAMPFIAPIAATSFRQMNYEVRIDYAYRLDERSKQKAYWSPFTEHPAEKRIDLIDFNLAFKTMNYFGSVIERLKIYNYHIEYNESTAISECLNRCASDSLKSLDLGVIKEDTLQKFNRSFGGVEELKIAINVDEVKVGNLNFNQIFTRISRLDLLMHADTDYSFIVSNHPKLTHLYLVVSKMILHRKDQIKAFFRANPQIHTFELEFAPQALLKEIAECLTNIQNLTLNLWHVGKDSVRFERVKFANLHHQNQYDRGSIKTLSFPQLQSLKMVYSLNDFAAVKEFFQKHPNLTCLHINAHVLERTAQFVDLTAELPSLVELTLEFNAYMTVENIGLIIDGHQKMQTLRLLKLRISAEDINILRRQFENNWHIKNIACAKWPGFLFERKNNTIV